MADWPHKLEAIWCLNFVFSNVDFCQMDEMDGTEIGRLHHTQHAPLLQIVDFHIDFDGNEFDVCENHQQRRRQTPRSIHGSRWKVFLG